MKKFLSLVAIATFCIGSVAHADLDTFHIIDIEGEEGSGKGAFSGDITGVNPVTIWNNPIAGDDFWNEGDTGSFLYDSERKSGDFTATVRAVGQSASIDGRWGKAGLMMRANLDGDSSNAMPSVYTGNGSQIVAPSAAIGNVALEHNPVINRVNGRTNSGNNGGGFERPMNDALGNAIDNNFAPTAAPGTIDAPVNASWLRLHYRAPTADAPNGTIIGAFALDDNGSPGDWAFSDPITDVQIDESEGWYVGLAYSAHNSLLPASQTSVPGPDGGANPDGLHGVRYDSYNFTSEYIEPVSTFRINGNSIGGLEIDSTLSNIELGPEETLPGLSTWWYDENVGTNVAGDGGFLDKNGLLNDTEIDPGLFGRVRNPVGFHGGNNSSRVINGVAYPGYPTGTFSDADRDNYSTIARGQIWVPEDGTYAIADGIDDFTMVAVDLNGENGIEGLVDLFDEDVGVTEALLNGNEVAILDGDWANFDLSGGPGDRPEERVSNNYNANLEFTGVAEGGEWRDFEMWSAEGGGGDGGFIYFGKADEFVWEGGEATTTADDGTVTSTPEGLTAEERDMFILGPDQLRTTGREVVSADAAGALVDGFNYIMQVGGEGSDQISIDDNGGIYETTLDVDVATIDIVDQGGLATGTEIQLFDADNIVGTPTLLFENEADWDLSKLSEGILTFVGEGGGLCNPNTEGDLDGSGTVDFADFLALSGAFGTPATSHEQGDIDCDGDVDFSDFLVLSGNFGNEVGGAQSVPEPSGLLLLGLAGLMGGLVRRRRN